jgi:hypothetical protein
MFIVMPIPRSRQAPEERHVNWRSAGAGSIPLLRSLAVKCEGHALLRFDLAGDLLTFSRNMEKNLTTRSFVSASLLALLLLVVMCGSPAKAQSPFSLYAVLNNNTQMVTINPANAQVIAINALTGLPPTTNWSFGSLTWSTRDAAFYALCYELRPPSAYDIYLMHLDPLTGVVVTNAFLGTFGISPQVLFEGLVFVDSLQELIASRWNGSGSDMSSKEIGVLSTNGTFTPLANNGRDNDALDYDSRRDLLYGYDGGNETLQAGLNTFARTSWSNSVTPVQLYSGKLPINASTYHRGLDAFYVSYVTNNTPQLVRWTTDGNQPVSAALIGPITGLPAGASLSALAPVPFAPAVSLKSPLSSTQTLCVAKTVSLQVGLASGSAPVRRVNYFDGGLLITSSTNAASAFSTNAFLTLGLHQLAAQAFDGFFTVTSPTQVVVFVPPASNYLAAQLTPDQTGCIVCLGGTVSNSLYIFQSATNLPNIASGWSPFSTNRALSSLLIFTNSPLENARFFRALLPD